MKYYELDKEEKEILDAIEKSKIKRVKNFAQEKKKLQQAAKFTLNKIKNINIRVTLKDLHKIKTLATEQGIPYQTLIASLIHQYSNNRTF